MLIKGLLFVDMLRLPRVPQLRGVVKAQLGAWIKSKN